MGKLHHRGKVRIGHNLPKTTLRDRCSAIMCIKWENEAERNAIEHLRPFPGSLWVPLPLTCLLGHL